VRVIAGKLKGRRLDVCQGSEARPTSDKARGALFSILGNSIVDACVLDAFAGSGAVGIEAISRQAAKVVFCDNDPQTLRSIAQVLTRFGVEASVYQTFAGNFQHCLSQLAREKRTFDFVFLDPPYDGGYNQAALELCVPLLAADGLVALEHDITQDAPTVEGLRRVDQRKYGRSAMSFYRLGVSE